MYVGYPLNEEMEFFQLCLDISKRQAKADDDFDPIYMVIGTLSNVYLGYISEPVGVLNHKDLFYM